MNNKIKTMTLSLILASSTALNISATTPKRLVATSLGAGAATYLALQATDAPKFLGYTLPVLTSGAVMAAILHKDAQNFKRYKGLIEHAQDVTTRVEKAPLMSVILNPHLASSDYAKFVLHSHIKSIYSKSPRPFSEAHSELKGLGWKLNKGWHSFCEAKCLSDQGFMLGDAPNLHHLNDEHFYENHLNLEKKLGYTPNSLRSKIDDQVFYIGGHLASLAKKAEEMDV